MGDFSVSWLRLREAIDRRSRSGAVAEGLRIAFAEMQCARVVDLGSGSGANLRATAPLLGPNQEWTLCDNDAALLAAADGILMDWADAAARTGEGLLLSKGGKSIAVRFQLCDIGSNDGLALMERADLVTASAFFDLASPAFIDRLVSAVARHGSAFHAVLTYDGAQAWSPSCVLDGTIIDSFNMHQTGDKGFGPAAGPSAPALLRRAFDAAGYRTVIGDSAWNLDGADGHLMEQLVAGIAAAVTETGRVDASTIAAWRGVVRNSVRVGHGDLLALPAVSRVSAGVSPQGFPPEARHVS